MEAVELGYFTLPRGLHFASTLVILARVAMSQFVDENSEVSFSLAQKGAIGGEPEDAITGHQGESTTPINENFFSQSEHDIKLMGESDGLQTPVRSSLSRPLPLTREF